jgi:diguanylate cyclase (GGDEF)-like protein/PAS domain S-box-containing protein
MSASSTNADVIATLTRRRSNGADAEQDKNRTPSLSRTDPTDAPHIQSGYFTKAIQSVLETLAPSESENEPSVGLQLLQSAIEQAQDAIVICEAPTEEASPNVCYTNQSFATWISVPRQEMQGQSLFDLPGWDLGEGGRRRILGALIEGKGYEGEMSGVRAQGGEYIVEVHFNPILKNGVCTHYIGIVRDVTSRKRIERELVHNAHHDALTGLPNRKLFRDRLDQSLRRAQRYQDGIALLYIDLDGFKPINDSLGHQMGDLVLQVVSSRLLDVVRASDTVARLGGDEFVVLLPSCAEDKHAQRVAEKIVLSINQVIVGQGKEIFITPSIGIAHFTQDAPDADELIKCADMAMYQAKAKGKSQYVLFTEELRGARQTQDMMADELANAIELEEFQLHYRPVFNTKTSQYAGAEPMLRWYHPQRGMVSPARFLPQLAKLPIEAKVAQWMLEASLKLAATWPASKSIYFTAFQSQLSDPKLAESIQRSLKKVGLKPQRLVFQIAESHLTELAESAVFQLVKLQALGVRIIISQYGTSNLSLPQMRNLPINGLKIDPTLTGRLETNGQLIRGIAALSKSLGLTIMADGVATARQLSALASLGCEACQGLQIGTPKPDIQF